MRRLLSSLAVWWLGCAEPVDARDATLRSVLLRSDESLARTRPALLAGRYARMAASPVAFYRGQMALFLSDWRDPSTGLGRSSFVGELPMPLGVGDPHVENFGTLVGPSGAITLEPNDLDGADRVPFLWDLRRLTVGLCVAARMSNPASAEARQVLTDAAGDVVRATVLAYLDALRPEAQPPRADVSVGAVIEDLFRRARRDVARRAELAERTEIREGVRRLRRGGIDEDDPTHVQVDLPSWAVASLPGMLGAYRSTLVAAPEERYFRVLDAVRELGSGVASFPRVRVIVLVRGPSDASEDDILLEVKEQTDAIMPGALPPGVVATSVPERVLRARDTLWSRPDADPLWGTATWLGVPVQVRHETEGAKNLRIERLAGALGTPAALTELGRVLGARLASMHRRSLPTPAPQLAVLLPVAEAFAREEADIALAYAARVFEDQARLARLLERHGPTLGFPDDPLDVPSSPVRALFGIPP